MGAQSEGHLDDESKILLGLAGANDHLYRFDNNHGVFVSGLADPMALEFAATGVGAGQYTKITSSGNTIFATGRNWFGNTVLDVFDTSTPEMEEHTSELQSLMRISYAVFCLKKKQQKYQH